MADLRLFKLLINHVTEAPRLQVLLGEELDGTKSTKPGGYVELALSIVTCLSEALWEA
jgi:hypothetical protein